MGRRRNFFSVRKYGNFYPSRPSDNFFRRKSVKSYFPRRIQYGFPRITKKQKMLVDRTVDGFFAALKQGAIDAKTKPQKRKRFTKKTKETVLKAQFNHCRICHQYLEVPEFDHINGDRSDNSVHNCQALCPNCHAKKTRKKTR